MDNQGFLSVNLGMNVGNSSVSTSGPFIQQLPGIQQIFTQNIQAKPIASQNVLQGNLIPVSTQQTGNQTLFAQSLVRPPTGNQSIFGHQQLLTQQTGLQQVIGPRSLYATNYQVVPRNYAVFNQNMPGTGLTVQLSPHQLGTNISTLPQADQQQLVQPATLDPNLSLQNPGQQHLAFQNSNGQLTIQSPTQQLTIQSPNQIALQSPTQQITLQNQNQFALQNQNLGQLAPQMISHGQNNNVIVQSQGQGMIIQGDNILPQGHGQNLFVQGQGLGPNFSQQVNQGQVFGPLQNLASSMLPNQMHGIYTQTPVLATQGPVNANAGILTPNLVTQVVKTDNNGNQLRMRAENEQKRPKTVNQQSRDILTLNQQMQILAQIAAQGQLNVQTSHPNPLLTNITSQNQGVVNAVNQNQYLSNLNNHQNSSLPSFGHFLLHHQQQQNLPHPFLQNTGFNPLGLQQAALTGIVGGQQTINGNVISAPNYQSGAIGQTPGVELLNNNTVSNNHCNNMNVDLTSWNVSPVLNPGVNVQSRPVNTVTDSRHAETGQTSIVSVTVASPLNVSAGTSVSKRSDALSTVNTPTSSVTGAVSKLPITFVTYGVSTVSTSKISTHTSLSTSDKLEMFRDKLSQSVLAFTSSVKQETFNKKEVSGNEGDQPTHTIVVPYGWVRALEGDSIVYYSPTCTRLTTIQHIKQYLATEGTCKCGLECPVLVEKVFNFNPSVISLKWSPADFGSRTFEEKCNHRQKNFAMAMMQINHPLTLAGHLESSIVTNSIMMSPRMSSTLQEKVKKDQKKRKKSVTHTGESMDSHIVSHLLKKKDLSTLNVEPSTSLSQQIVSENVGTQPKVTDVMKRTNIGCESINQDRCVTEETYLGCDTYQHLESNSCDNRLEEGPAGVSFSSVVKGGRESVSEALAGSSERGTVPIESGSVSNSSELFQKSKERNEPSALCDNDTHSKNGETKEEIILCVDRKLKLLPLISENTLSGSTATITTSILTSSVQQLQQPLAIQTSGKQNITTASNPSTCVSNTMKVFSSAAKSPIKEKGTKQVFALPIPSKSGRCSSQSSSSSCISSEIITGTHSPEKTSSSDKVVISMNEYSLCNSLGQVINNLGFDGSSIPPLFGPSFTCNSALINKMPMLRGANTFSHLGIKDSSMTSSPAVEKQPTTLYPPDIMANLHKLASPPNQQVFPLTQAGQRFQEPSHNRMSKYIHGEISVVTQKVIDGCANKVQILSDKDLQVKSCSEVGSTTDDFKEVDMQAEKIKHKTLNSGYERENVKVTELFESDSPPPNVDVSQLKDKGHGVIPKQKIASFLENPAEFLKQQTVIVNNSISSTSSSPKPDGNEKYLKPITISKEVEEADDIPAIAERSESASSDRLDLPKEQTSLNDRNVPTASVTRKNREQLEGQPHSVSSNSNEPGISEVFSTIISDSSKGHETVEACCSQSEVQKPVASAPPTPTTIVHYTPISLSCHQISVNKAKLHSNLGNENIEKSVKQRALHPIENVFSDQAISHAFQQMFPQIMQEALLENLGLLNSSFREISNCSTIPSTKLSVTTGAPKASDLQHQVSSRQQQPGRPSLTQRVPTSLSFVSPGSSQIHPPNFPIHHVLGNQIRSGGDFPASNLLSAAARAQLFQQNNPLHLIMTQQAGGQIINPFLPSVGNIGATTILPETAQSLSHAPIQVPLQSSGNFQASPVSASDNINTANNSASANLGNDTNEKARLKPGSAKISELLSRVDSEKLKHKLTQVQSSSSELPPGLDMALLLHHLHQQQQQQLQLHNNISLQQNPTSGIQSISVSTVTTLVTNENNIPINQPQQASSNLLNLPANIRTNLTDGLQGTMPLNPISGPHGNNVNGYPTVPPHMLQMYNALGLQQSQDILNNNPQSNSSSGTFPQLQDNPILFGHVNLPGLQSLPVCNTDVRQISNPIQGTASSLGHMASGSLISSQNEHASFCPTYPQQDPLQMNPNLIMHLVNPVNGDQVFLNMQGLGNGQVDERNVGLIPTSEIRTSQASIPGIQTQQVGNQMTMINGNKSNLQQVRSVDNNMDIQNIALNPQTVQATNKTTNSVPNNTNCNNLHMPPNSVLPVNLINVQQSLSGSNNLTAMQLQTLQLQQQLLQQIQQVQGMQNLINQYNLQGIVNSNTATGDKSSKSQSPAATRISDANRTQNTVQTTTGNIETVSNVPDVSKQSVMNSALTKAGLMTVTPVQVNTQQCTNSSAVTATSNTCDNEILSRDNGGIRKANHVIAAAADTTDDSPAAKKVDIGTETEAFDDEEDDDVDACESDAGSDSQEMDPSTTLDTRQVPETTTSPAKSSNSSGVPLNVSTCLAIATQKGQVDSKLAGLKSSVRVSEAPVENMKRSLGDLKLKISRKHLFGSTVSSIVSRTKKHKLTEEFEDEPQVKFEKKELRSSTVAATKASSSLASSSTETLNGESSRKTCSTDSKERKESISEENMKESGMTNTDQGLIVEVLATKEAKKLDCSKEKTLIETPECDSSVNTSELNETENISESVRDKKQSELTNKIAAALSNQRGRWQLSTLKVSSVACSSTVDDEKNSEMKTEAHCSNNDFEVKGVKRPRDDLELEDTASSDDEGIEENESSIPVHPRSFNTGDLVWGQIRGFPSWPGKLVDNSTGKISQKPEDGKLFVRWFGDHTITQVEPQKLKTLSEGLEAHHRARKKHRRGRKMNSNLEQAIHQAMAELDKQAAQNLDGEKPEPDKVHKPVKRKHRK